MSSSTPDASDLSGGQPQPSVKRARKVSWKRRLLFIFAPLLFLYLLIEGAFTGWMLLSGGGGSSQLFEEIGKPLYQYDPVIGSRLSPENVRTAIILPDGVVESSAVIRGNNLGLPDEHDFLPQKPAGVQRRYAVFGGSYIAGLYMNRKYPDRLEEIAMQSGEKVEFMNCCCEGSGLTNWWLLTTNILNAEKFELDGVIFTVSDDNLYRGLLAMHDSFKNGWHTVYVNQIRTVSAADIPRTFEAAEPLLYHICMQDSFRGTPVFDRIWASAQDPGYRVSRGVLMPIRPYLTWMLFTHVGDKLPPHSSSLFGKPESGGNFDAMAKSRINDIRKFLESKRLPAVVIQLPPAPASEVPSKFSEWIPDASLEFANRLGVPFWDGREAYRSMKDEEYSSLFLDHDPHWNQKGSDLFAKETYDYLLKHPMSIPRTTEWQPVWHRLGVNVDLTASSDRADALRVSLSRSRLAEPWNNWDAQLIREMTFEKGKSYECSFEARSDEPRKIFCYVMNESNKEAVPNTWKEIELTSDWKTIHHTFTPEITSSSTPFVLEFGKDTTPFEISGFKMESNTLPAK